MYPKKFSNSKPNITIADVAKAAGVSIPTVSRILNNKVYVADETRDRVNQAIKELGYVPHIQARQLRGAPSQTLALHYPVESPEMLSSVVEIPYVIGAAAAASKQGYFLNFLVSQLTPDTLLNIYRSNQVDGLILLQVSLDDWRVNLLREQDYPFVMIGRCANLEDLSFIDLDFETAMIEAFDHLVALGHREIGLLTYPERWRTAGLGPAAHSLAGYERALQKHSLGSYYREVELSGVEAGFAATQDLLEERPQLTAIIATNHLVAAGSIKALTQRGYRVPEDCSVLAIGFGEIANGITPSLTALEWSSYEVSYQATLIMTNQLKEKRLPVQQILVAPRLVIRESTKEAI
ncbi:MAG TPA: LacI family DNA-binding transcriptional regulator [Phototrophicaceae bacterium]|nr:LacI family DNA-binding transcriptional regulator [Phototrophicaceae bacterium]